MFKDMKFSIAIKTGNSWEGSLADFWFRVTGMNYTEDRQRRRGARTGTKTI